MGDRRLPALPWPQVPGIPREISIERLTFELRARDRTIAHALEADALPDMLARALRNERHILQWIIVQLAEHRSGRAVPNLTTIIRDAQALLERSRSS